MTRFLATLLFMAGFVFYLKSIILAQSTGPKESGTAVSGKGLTQNSGTDTRSDQPRNSEKPQTSVCKKLAVNASASHQIRHNYHKQVTAETEKSEILEMSELSVDPFPSTILLMQFTGEEGSKTAYYVSER